MEDDQLISYLFIFLIFIVVIIFVRLWPFKIKKESYQTILKYQKSVSGNSDDSDIDGDKLKEEVDKLVIMGYEITTAGELFKIVSEKTCTNKKFFLILNFSESAFVLEPLKDKLKEIDVAVVIFKPILCKI